MPAIIRKGKGKFLVRVFLGRDPATGKRRYHSKLIHGNRRKAEAYATSVQHQVDTGTWREDAVTTVGELLARWMEETAPRRVRPKTLEGYRDSIRVHIGPAVGRIPLSTLKPAVVQRLVAAMERKGRAPQTIRNAVGVLRNALNTAVKQGTIPSNPASAELVDFPKAQRRPMTVLTLEEAQAFVEAAKGERWGVVFIVLLGSGMRPAEALGLGWDDFDGHRVRIHRSLTRARNAAEWNLREPKTKNSRRTVPLPRFALEALREHRRVQAEERLRAGAAWKDHGLIFVDELGEPLRWQLLARREFRWILQEAELPKIRPYDLRHTCASLLLSAGTNPKVVSERLGHSTVALTLDTYSAVLPGLQEEATEKLGEMFG